MIDALREDRVAPEDCSDLLAALGEEFAAEDGEGAGIVRERVGVSADGDHLAGDLWLGPEALGGQGGDALDGAECLHDDGEFRVVAGARMGTEALGDLALDGDKLAAAVGMVGGKGDDEWAGGGIGEIRNEGEESTGDGIGDLGIEQGLVGEAVGVDECESASGDVFVEAVLQDRDEIGVDFAGDDGVSPIDELICECAGAGADLEDEIVVVKVGGVDDLSNEILIDEEILPEDMLG